MGLQPSRSLAMVLSLYLMLMAINWTCASIQYRMFDSGNPFTFGGLRNAILHRQLQQEPTSESVVWPKYVPLNQGQRSSRQFQPAAGSSGFIPLGNLEVEHRAINHPAQNAQQYEVQNATPEPQTESPIVFRPYTPPVPQPLPPPYIAPAQQPSSNPAPYNQFTAPAHQSSSNPAPYNPFTASAQQSSNVPAPYNPFTAPAQQTTPAPAPYNPYNTPPPLPTPAPTPFTPYVAPNPQPQPIAAPFAQYVAPTQQPQPAPTPFTPYNNPAPQPTPFTSNDASGTYTQVEQTSSNHQNYQPAAQSEPIADSRSQYEAHETQGPYGPPQPTEQFSVFQEMARHNLISWPDNYAQQQQEEPAEDRHSAYPTPQPADHQPHRNSYASSRYLNFEPSYSQFAKRSLESPPSPADLGFPSISSTAENWNMDVNWANFAGKRKRRSAQRPSRDQGRRKIIEDYDNIAIEGRQTSETRVPAPASRSAPSKREGSKQEPKQEYDGPYVYTQLFGPPYEVGYIRSPIPSKHVYEDYLQFVRSWSSASREAVDDQLRANPAAAKEYSSVKYKENGPAYKEAPQKDSYKEPAPAYKEPAPAYKEPAPAYKEPAPAYKEPAPAYKEPAPAYKEPAPAYKDSTPAYKEPAAAYSEPEYKAPTFKGPSQSYKEPAYTESDYKEPAYKEPAYKESTAAYKEPEYKAPSFKGPSPSYKEPAYTETDYKEPAYKQPAHKEPAYKEQAPAYKEPEYKEPAYNKEPEYKEPAYKEPVYAKEPEYKEPAYKEPAYKEPAYQAPTPAYSEPAYKEPEYKDPAPAYKEPAYNKEPEYKEPAYKEPEYKEPVHKASDYKEESYKESPRTDRPVFRDEIHYKETPHKQTAHKSAYKEESYETPNINYHSPQADYVAPETEFRPTNRPYEAVGPKSPVYMERDFIPIKSQAASYDTPTTTYRTTTTYNDAPLSYDILKAFEKARPSSDAYAPAPAYPPTAVYEPVTTKYKAAEASYDPPTPGYEAVTTKYKATEAPYEAPKYEQTAYEAPKRYVETPPVRDYLPAKKYENPPARNPPSAAYYKPPNRYVEPPVHGSKYEAPAAYDAPAPAKYSEPAYEASAKYAESAAYPVTNKPDAYRVEQATTAAYKENYPADDYAPSGYKDDVELSSTSYQAVSKNYDSPSDDYAQPPVAYDQVKKTEESYPDEKESYPSTSYDDAKKDDTYGADAGSSASYEAPKKKHYPVIIGRYQVTDSSAFLPKKVGGGESSTGVKSVGSQVHGSSGDEYVVYYLPYGQPLPVPVRRRRNTEDSQSTYSIRRLKSLADRQRYPRKLSEESQSEQQVLTPQEAHKYSFLNAKTEETSTESVEDVVTQTTGDVRSQDEFLSPESEPKKVHGEVVSSYADVGRDETVSPQVDKVQDEIVSQIDVGQDEIVSLQVDQVQSEIILPHISFAQDDTFPAEGLQDESPLVDEMVVAQIEEDLTKSSLLSDIVPETPSGPTGHAPGVEEPVGEIIIVKVPAEDHKEHVIVAVEEVSITHVEPADASAEAFEESGIANVDFITGQQEDGPAFTSDVAYNTEEIKKFSADSGAYNGKKKPAIFKQSILPGLTQKPVEYIRPPGIAAESKEHWNGYSTWWTKLGHRVAKQYNYE